ncbi:MAG: CoA-binding protein [Epsilonproteobacteria bacterium]|nr:CoA-binding protein [Campylobacterota bacterium]
MDEMKERIEKILKNHKVVAIVGLSPKEERPSRQVAQYLQKHGYKIVPVRPGMNEILGEKCYSSLSEIPFPIDVVDIFRKSETVMPIIDEAIKIGAKSVWLQLGIKNPEAEKKAESAGLLVVSDRCMKIEHSKKH